MSQATFFDMDPSEGLLASRETRTQDAVRADKLLIEIVELEKFKHLISAWADLVRRALEPNIFLEPAFAVPLYQHCEATRKAQFLLAWSGEDGGSQRRLLGLSPFASPRFPAASFAQGAAHPHAPLGVPLFDRTYGALVLTQMIDWLALHRPHLTGLIFSHIPRQGPTFALLQHCARSRDESLYLLGQYERAGLSIQTSDGNPVSAKRRKQRRQQRRRLSEKGTVEYRTIRDPSEIRRAAESFLALECQGWKGSRRTALLAASQEATFFRTMTRLMSREGKCRIDSLNVDGAPVAMGVVLESGDRALYWKTTYDERFAALSPGVHLTLELTQTQLASPSVTFTDSCAVPNHPMINRIWKDRIAMADVLLPIPRRRGFAFTLNLYGEKLCRTLRAAAKHVVTRIRR